MALEFSQRAIADARRFNRLLAWLPRFKIRNRLAPTIVQGLLRASQIGSDSKLERKAIRVQHFLATSEQSPAVPVRILRPHGAVRAVVIDIHGGGWVIGNPQMNDKLNESLISACGVAVVSVDYRLAVDTPIEGLLSDCLAASRWVLSGGLLEYADLPVFMVGESAGAHLTAATLLHLKEEPALIRKIAGVVLYYGLYDLAGTESVRNAGPDTLVLDGPGMAKALSLLTPGLSEPERRCAPLSPLYGDMQGLPPALMFVGTLDPLIDDTNRMAARWWMHGKCECHVVVDAPHGFIHFPTQMARETLEYSQRWIDARLTDFSRSP